MGGENWSTVTAGIEAGASISFLDVIGLTSEGIEGAQVSVHSYLANGVNPNDSTFKQTLDILVPDEVGVIVTPSVASSRGIGGKLGLTGTAFPNTSPAEIVSSDSVSITGQAFGTILGVVLDEESDPTGVTIGTGLGVGLMVTQSGEPIAAGLNSSFGLVVHTQDGTFQLPSMEDITQQYRSQYEPSAEPTEVEQANEAREDMQSTGLPTSPSGDPRGENNPNNWNANYGKAESSRNDRDDDHQSASDRFKERLDRLREAEEARAAAKKESDGNRLGAWVDDNSGITTTYDPKTDSYRNHSNGDGNTGGYGMQQPILLDLDGNGIEITELSNSTTFTDAGGNGLQHKTAWAGAGDGVLFFDPEDLGTIEEKRQYVFTEWDPTATSDMEALRSVFDSNGDGVFDANDAEWAKFKVLVSSADGRQTSSCASISAGLA